MLQVQNQFSQLLYYQSEDMCVIARRKATFMIQYKLNIEINFQLRVLPSENDYFWAFFILLILKDLSRWKTIFS